MEYALAVQELFPALYQQYNTAEQFMHTCAERYAIPISRIYLGASFCGRLFNVMTVSQFRFFSAYCTTHNMPVSLTIPIFTQQHLAEGKRVIQTILDTYGRLIDEVTVNDCGMYVWLRNQFKGRIFSGRLMNKVNRDPRYPAYGNLPIRIPEVPFSVSGAELDSCASALIIESGHDEFVAAVYSPYSFISTGETCSYASLYLDVAKKFTPVTACPVNCGRYYTRHEDSAGNIFYHIGNTIYFKAAFPKIIGTTNQRSICMPLELWEERHETVNPG